MRRVLRRVGGALFLLFTAAVVATALGSVNLPLDNVRGN